MDWEGLMLKFIFGKIFVEFSNSLTYIIEGNYESVGDQFGYVNHYNNLVRSHPILAKIWKFKKMSLNNHQKYIERVESPKVKF